MRLIGLVLALAVGLSAQADGEKYCLAIRGNGELAPAHWGAVANVVEKLGLPEKQAGGSSASITMLMLDAVATNKLVKNASLEQQRIYASFLVKSFEGFADYLAGTPEFQDFIDLYMRAGDIKGADWTNQLLEFFAAAVLLSEDSLQDYIRINKELLIRNFRTGMTLGLISETTQPQLFNLGRKLTGGEALSVAEIKEASFYVSELVYSIKVFGKFDAFSDSNLFFRNGIIDFDRLSDQVGRVAEFYARGADSEEGAVLWADFLDSCGPFSTGKTWRETVAANPMCASRFQDLIDSFYAETVEPAFYKEPVGVTIASLPATAVLVGQAAEEATDALRQYHSLKAADFGRDFKLSNPEGVRFGYWGRHQDLVSINESINRGDEKSRRFYPIGRGTWKLAVSLSPAEPGLSPLRPFKSDDETPLVSAGGWSDLHPIAALKASGCERVVYVTRRGGESLFGQGVAKRLLLYDRDWSYLSTQPGANYDRNKILNNIGDATDMSSLWSRLYNVANPQSSFRLSLAEADAVLCTDWNRFDIREGIREMITDSYRSPYFVRNRSAFPKTGLVPQLNTREMHPDGYPIFAGCF